MDLPSPGSSSGRRHAGDVAMPRRFGGKSVPRSASMRAWLSLVRLPNLLTVPGDALAGFLLALAARGLTPYAAGNMLWGRALAATTASLLLYIHGLIQNDLCDLRIDSDERPGRPLPSGAISRRQAGMVCLLAGVAGMAVAGWIGFAGFAIALALALTVSLYNVVLKHYRLPGTLAMGLCRALSLLLGAAAAGWPWETSAAVPAAAAMVWFYVAAVTAVAADETRAAEPGFRRWLPSLVLAAGIGLLAWAALRDNLGTWYYAAFPGLPAVFYAWIIGRRLSGCAEPERIQAGIGQWLRGLLLLQFAAVATGWGGLIAPATVFLVLWYLHSSLSAKFACT